MAAAKTSGRKKKSEMRKLEGKGCNIFYVTKKRVSNPEKLSCRKYNPVTRKHEIFTEKKI